MCSGGDQIIVILKTNLTFSNNVRRVILPPVVNLGLRFRGGWSFLHPLNLFLFFYFVSSPFLLLPCSHLIFFSFFSSSPPLFLMQCVAVGSLETLLHALLLHRGSAAAFHDRGYQFFFLSLSRKFMCSMYSIFFLCLYQYIYIQTRHTDFGVLRPI